MGIVSDYEQILSRNKSVVAHSKVCGYFWISSHLFVQDVPLLGRDQLKNGISSKHPNITR